MTEFAPDFLKSATSGRWLVKAPSKRRAQGISTDSRALTEGQAFLALHGEHHDAHDYLPQVIAAGASIAIIDEARHPAVKDAVANKSIPILEVRSTPLALLDLAHAHRQRLTKTKVVAVTGSNGKTTTVRLIKAALSQRFKVCASEKSFNNHIGVPLTILRAETDCNFLICEVGTSNPGEIAHLAQLVEPHIAVLTSLGRAHVGQFPSLEDYFTEKATLFHHLAPNGTAVIAESTRRHVADALAPIPNVISFGPEKSADIRITDASQLWLDGKPATRGVVDATTPFTLPIPGLHNAANAGAAFAIARESGQPDAQTADALAALEPAPMRVEYLDIAGISICCDAYNANPESTKAAIATFDALSTDANRRILILGDMLELGKYAADAHEEIAQLVADTLEPDLLVAVGEHAPRIAHAVERAHPKVQLMIFSELTNDRCAAIADRIQPGDAVLLKASRGIALERIVHAIEAKAAAPAP